MVNDDDLVMTFPEGSIEELEARIKVMKAAREEERKRKLESTPLIWRYTIQESAKTTYHFEGLMDPSVKLYRISGEIANKEEAEAAGHLTDKGGGMDFYYNTLSQRFIASTGGGHYFISDDRWSSQPARPISAEETWRRIEDFIVNNPEGGDITQIIREHRGES